MKMLFASGFGPLLLSPEAVREFFGRTLGINVEEVGDGYVHNDKLERLSNRMGRRTKPTTCFRLPTKAGSRTPPTAVVNWFAPDTRRTLSGR